MPLLPTFRDRLRTFAFRWCWPCTFVGIGLMAAAGVAIAANNQPQALGFTSRDIIVGLLGLVMAVGGSFVAGLRGRLNKIEENAEELDATVDELDSRLRTQYLSRADHEREAERQRSDARDQRDRIESMVRELKMDLNELFGRSNRPNHADDSRG